MLTYSILNLILLTIILQLIIISYPLLLFDAATHGASKRLYFNF